MVGPSVRTDIVDVYVFRLCHDRGDRHGQVPATDTTGSVRFLQLRRAQEPMAASWQPVMGHVQPDPSGETAAEAALRELFQETGYRAGAGLIGFWQLESVSPYFLATQNCVILSPCFAARVAGDVDPVLNQEHDAFRWVRHGDTDHSFLWPGQRVAINQIVRDILPGAWAGGSVAKHLQIDF